MRHQWCVRCVGPALGTVTFVGPCDERAGACAGMLILTCSAMRGLKFHASLCLWCRHCCVSKKVKAGVCWHVCRPLNDEVRGGCWVIERLEGLIIFRALQGMHRRSIPFAEVKMPFPTCTCLFDTSSVVVTLPVPTMSSLSPPGWILCPGRGWGWGS